MVVLFYHLSVASYGEVLPAYTLPGGEVNPLKIAASYAQAYARSTAYEYYTLWEHYAITGEAINWCGEQGIACFDVELPRDNQKRDDQLKMHLDALVQLLQLIAKTN